MGHSLLCENTAVYSSHWMPLHVYLRRTNVYSPSYVPPLISFLSSSTLPLKELIHVKRLLVYSNPRPSQFSIHGAVDGASPVSVHVPQPISSTEDPSYRCQSTNGAPKTPFGVPQTVQSRMVANKISCAKTGGAAKSRKTDLQN